MNATDVAEHNFISPGERPSLPLTRRRRIALLIGAPLALVVIALAALTEIAWAGQGSFKVSLSVPVTGHTATIGVDSGQVHLAPVAGTRVRVTGTAHYSVIRSHVTWKSTSSGVNVQSQCSFIAGPCSFDYHVGVPIGLSTFASIGAGDLVATGLTGPVTLIGGSGNVTASALSGTVNLSDQSGSIVASGLTSRDVTAGDQSGDITLIFSTVPRRVVISDQAGNIKLVLPHGQTAYRVNASTTAGTSTIAVPTSSFSPYVITITNQAGDITVTR